MGSISKGEVRLNLLSFYLCFLQLFLFPPIAVTALYSSRLVSCLFRLLLLILVYTWVWISSSAPLGVWATVECLALFPDYYFYLKLNWCPICHDWNTKVRLSTAIIWTAKNQKHAWLGFFSQVLIFKVRIPPPPHFKFHLEDCQFWVKTRTCRTHKDVDKHLEL